MTTFTEREQGFEAKYRHDQETRFKIIARRNKLLGLWAAGKLGLAGAEAEAYARKIVISDFEEPGEEDVYRAVAADLGDKGVSEGDIRRRMAQLIDEAGRQIADEA